MTGGAVDRKVFSFEAGDERGLVTEGLAEELFRGGLFTDLPHDVAARAEEDHIVALVDHIGEIGVFGQVAVSGVDGVAAMLCSE